MSATSSLVRSSITAASQRLPQPGQDMVAGAGFRSGPGPALAGRPDGLRPALQQHDAVLREAVRGGNARVLREAVGDGNARILREAVRVDNARIVAEQRPFDVLRGAVMLLDPPPDRGQGLGLVVGPARPSPHG